MKPRMLRRPALSTAPAVVMDKAPPGAPQIGNSTRQKVAAGSLALLLAIVVLAPDAVAWDYLLRAAQDRFGLAAAWRYAVPLLLFVAAAQLVGYLAARLMHGYLLAKEKGPPSIGARAFYVVALSALLVSADTSWRLFEWLGITAIWERAVLFAVMEISMIACGVAMRSGVRTTGRPGPARLLGWALCGVAAFGAIAFSGPVVGVLRVLLGPVLSLVALHLALGIEIRSRDHARSSTWERVVRELRERALSRLGLADDQRDALTRTRDRAARRAARLALAGKTTLLRRRRLERALRASNVAHDELAKARMLTELAAIRHADKLSNLDQPSPWNEPPGKKTQIDAELEETTGGNESPDPTEPGEPRPSDVEPGEKRRSLAEIARTSQAQAIREAWRINGVVGLPELEDIEPAVTLLAEHGVTVTPKYARTVRLRDIEDAEAEGRPEGEQVPELQVVGGTS
ncbi:hypothetical protein K1T35_47935 (plasmid) [Pseudonocardia sp. DSM 110487]|uniref:hypothetical protein n=1 Tax=Pseudonocardia sp. DSM 110487 TaxID=2865833 RepID=UPI001C6995E0|nr:hypothetical protein [Pseudonocardia sp. DSM 110487]QYN41082.1 hypothetical protein K1T35_47935 [Pseudonocardia sp. DSM 110487]